MEEEARIGRQTPTRSYTLPYTDTLGPEAIGLYNSSPKTAQPWQELILYDMMAVRDDGLWVHTKFGYSVPRRNGKNEVVTMREAWGLIHGERILHTAHRTTTSSSASKRLADLLNALGYKEVQRPQSGQTYTKSYSYGKLFGLEHIRILDEGGGSCDFRTRSSKGGLGEGFDLLVIDEAQEYTDDQASALKYVVTDSANPQTVFCGTPPTPVSSGTVFTKMRSDVLSGSAENSGWAEWSVEEMTNVRDKDAWYETNPSLGTVFTERSITDEIGTDDVDFNIQRLGLWIHYNQKSAISENEWRELLDRPHPTGKMAVGIKIGRDGTNIAMAAAVRQQDGTVFTECIGCKPVRNGTDWVVSFCRKAEQSISDIVIDGASGQDILCAALKDAGVKKRPILPKVQEVINACAMFEAALYGQSIKHGDQPAVAQVVANCEKRAIGTNGGFGYKSIKDGADIALLDAIIFAHWACINAKETKRQKVTY